MSFNKDIEKKWVLIIDDLETMRAQLRMTLSNVGFAKLHAVGSIKEALARMAVNQYDLILCDYILGDDTNGQEFLEYLRSQDLIIRNTVFVMITAEQSYKKVIAAVECAPDDYILKPFTPAELFSRLEKLFERQEYFLSIDKVTDTKNWGGVIAECEKKIAVKDKNYIQLCKIDGSALMRAGRFQDAADIYNKVLEQMPLNWAKLGLARAMLKLGKPEEAKLIAEELLIESPQYMAAYDFLAQDVSDVG